MRSPLPELEHSSAGAAPREIVAERLPPTAALREPLWLVDMDSLFPDCDAICGIPAPPSHALAGEAASSRPSENTTAICIGGLLTSCAFEFVQNRACV